MFSQLTMPAEFNIFFAVLQRFEFALKEEGFLQGAKVDHEVKASWEKFADALPAGFFNFIEKSKRATDLLDDPPKKQIWSSMTTRGPLQPIRPNNARELFIAMRVVRNSLFHGIKADPTTRDQRLVHQSLFVLHEAIKACPQVKERFGAYYID